MLVLGIDLSTQSCTFCVLDTDKKAILKSVSSNFRSLPQMKASPMDPESLLIPAPTGCAEQDPAIFLHALEDCFAQISSQCDCVQIGAIQISAQQHGHVYLNEKFRTILSNLSSKGEGLATIFASTYAHPYAPIWRSSDTQTEASALREVAGGKKAVIQLTGSDSPLRFTGAVIKKFVDKHPKIYQETAQILLLNTWLAAILSGNPDTACDFGNGSGTSLMDYSRKAWDSPLLSSISPDLEQKLPVISSPNSIAGKIAPFFREKYGFSENCLVGIGTGDNPASKVVSSGDILSLGTSFVYMKNTDLNTRDFSGTANAMFDGLGNPFTIFCRTNGALVWDRVRERHNANYAQASEALARTRDEYPIFLWQPEQESVPLSPICEYRGNNSMPFSLEYRGIVLSSLCLLHSYTSTFGVAKEISVTGGPVGDPEILRIISQIWECPVRVLPSGGAALGAALAAYILVNPKASLQEIQHAMDTNTVPPITVEPTPALDTYKSQLLSVFREINHG